MLWRKDKKQKQSNIIGIQKFQPFFITTDNKEHEGLIYENNFNANELSYITPEYFMINIKRNGYIKDKDNVMYPLENIISIKWKLIEEKII